MNELIKQLKQQAGVDFNPDQEGLDLFARLIVEECAELAGKESSKPCKSYSELIKQHFGVEE